jgi:FMN phosphatase YigB (HAD superfamily)
MKLTLRRLQNLPRPSLQGVSFDMILTAQDIGSYKPDLRNFEYMLSAVQT